MRTGDTSDTESKQDNLSDIKGEGNTNDCFEPFHVPNVDPLNIFPGSYRCESRICSNTFQCTNFDTCELWPSFIEHCIDDEC